LKISTPYRQVISTLFMIVVQSASIAICGGGPALFPSSGGSQQTIKSHKYAKSQKKTSSPCLDGSHQP